MSVNEADLQAYLAECERLYRKSHGEVGLRAGKGIPMADYKRFADKYINEPWESACTKKNYTSSINRFIRFMDENGYTEINNESLMAYRRSLIGHAPNTMSKYLTRLETSFNWMVKMGLIFENPFPKSMRIRERYETAKPILDENGLLCVLNPVRPKSMTRLSFFRSRAIVALLVTSGLREGELIALTPNDLHWEKGTLTVRSGKGRKGRFALFHQIAQNAVRDYMTRWRPKGAGDEDPVFLVDKRDGSWKPFTGNGVSANVKTYIRLTTGRDDLSVHSLRHSFASFLATNNLNTNQLQVLLGHSSLLQTQRYAKLLAPDATAVESAKEIFDDFFISAGVQMPPRVEKKQRGRKRAGS